MLVFCAYTHTYKHTQIHIAQSQCMLACCTHTNTNQHTLTYTQYSFDACLVGTYLVVQIYGACDPLADRDRSEIELVTPLVLYICIQW